MFENFRANENVINGLLEKEIIKLKDRVFF